MQQSNDWFPLSDPLRVGNYNISCDEILSTIGPTLSTARKIRIHQVVAARIFGATVVLEEISDHGNIAAVLRTAEGLGFGTIHIINNSNTISEKPPNRVTQGADKWIMPRHWHNSSSCIESLRSSGFLIAATSVSSNASPVAKVDLNSPIAIVFGNEHHGVSKSIQETADILVNVPMHGFSRSFNISVAAAIILSQIRDRLHSQASFEQLNVSERRILTACYYIAAQPKAERLLLSNYQRGNQK